MHLRIRLVLLTCALFLGARSVPALPPPTPPPLLTTTPPAQPTVPAPPPWQPAPQATPPAITTPSPVPTAPPATVKQIHFGPAATVVLPTAESAVIYSINGIFQLVGLPQDQITQVTVQYPTSQVSQIVKVEALDGGLLTASASAEVGGYNVHGYDLSAIKKRFDSGTPSADGNFTFIFQAGHLPGLYQIRVQQGNQVLGLQFWVLDSQHPANNPPAIKPVLISGTPNQLPVPQPPQI